MSTRTTPSAQSPADSAAAALLDVRALSVVLTRAGRQKQILNRVSLHVRPGEVLGLVGATGSGKSLTILATLGLLASGAKVTEGEVLFDGRDLLRLRESDLRRLRGSKLALIPQSAKTALNPLLTVDAQMRNVLQAHHRAGLTDLRSRVEHLLRDVELEPSRVLGRYPHELSGGMAQRVGIAIAFGCSPDIVLADEPTTGLDVTVQAQVLDKLVEGLAQRGTSALLISHDISVVSNYCDRVAVMQAGQIVETGDVETVMSGPEHPYTRALLSASHWGQPETPE